MTLKEIATYWVLILTEVVVVAGGVEEDLEPEYEVGEADVVVGEGGMEFLPRMRLTYVPISPNSIILRNSTAGSVLQKIRRFGRTKVNSLELPARIRVTPLQSMNLMSTSFSCLQLLRAIISVFATSRLTMAMRTLWTWVMTNPS